MQRPRADYLEQSCCEAWVSSKESRRTFEALGALGGAHSDALTLKRKYKSHHLSPFCSSSRVKLIDKAAGSMARGRIKRILMPYLVRHILFALAAGSLIFLVYLMLHLVGTLSHEISRMSDQQHQLSTEQVLYYIKNFLMLVLYGSLQLFGLYGLVRSHRNILVAYGSSLLVAFIFTVIDHMLNSGYLLVAFYLLTQSLFVLVYLLVFPLKNRPISNIHYIPMPSEEASTPQVTSNQKYFRF